MEKSSSMKTALIGIVVAAVLAGGVFAFAQSNSDDEMTTATNQSTVVENAPAASLPFDLNLTNLSPLEQGEYEGWVVRGDDKLSFGRFNMTESGMIDGDLSFDGELQDGDTVAISIEPDNDSDPGPSATIILAGEVQDGTTDLAFPLDISAFSGQYILATPTTTTTDDETAGVWFTTTGSDTSLNIPVAPEGWAYEGWAVVDGTPYSTGLFTDPSQADLFDGYSGPENAPNKPGEDFVANLENAPLDLRGSTIVVSVEPFQDGVDPTGDKPAQVKPLTSEVAADAIDHSAFDLTLGTDSLPSGTVSS